MKYENLAHEEEYRGCKIKLVYDEDPLNPREEWDNVGTMVCWHRRYKLGDEQPRQEPGEWFQSNIQRTTWREERFCREALIRAKFDERAKQGFATPEEHEEHEQDLVDELADIDSLMEDDDKLCQELFDKDHVRLPLYLYDHSGITMSTSRFSCPWDSGQVGFIYCSLEKARHEWGKPDSAWDSPVKYGDKVITLREAAVSYLEGEVETYDAYLTGQVVGYVAEDWDGEEISSCWGYFPDEREGYGKRWDYPISEAKAAIDHHIEMYGERCSLNEGEH